MAAKLARSASRLDTSSVPLFQAQQYPFARTWLERGGDVYSLSRLMGHSSVTITEIYPEDFKSRQARSQHTQFSPVSKMRIRQRGHGRHTYQRGPRSGGEKPRKDQTETDTDE